MTILTGIVEVLSLSALIPFLAAISAPDILLKNQYFSYVVQSLGLTTSAQVIFFTVIAFAASVILVAFIRSYSVWINLRYSAAIGSDLSGKLYRSNVYQTYANYLARNSSEVIALFTQYLPGTVNFIESTLQLLTSIVVFTFLVSALLVLNWQVTASLFLILSSAYFLFAIKTRQIQNLKSKQVADSIPLILKSIQEAFGGLREIILDGTQHFYLNNFIKYDRPQRYRKAEVQFLGYLPRFIFEGVGLVSIAISATIIVTGSETNLSVIPILGTLALGAQRLLPSLQQIYISWARVDNGRVNIQPVISELLGHSEDNVRPSVYPLINPANITFMNVSFKYPSSHGIEVLSGINLQLNLGQYIGIVGTTGSGKSTFVDLLMGLLLPSTGNINVNNVSISDPSNKQHLFNWRASISHVPQSIYLLDATIAENIAFGSHYHQIDFDQLRFASNCALLSEFIDTQSEGYNTIIGERGARLSGGQRQRIAIARALYKNTRILIFDEATSALDVTTEQAIISNLLKMRRSSGSTIISVSHRLSTLELCDCILRFDNGRLQEMLPQSNLIK